MNGKKSNKIEIMVDIETLARDTNAVVYEIAAVAFEEEEFKGDLHTRDLKVWYLDISSQIVSGRTLDAKTLEFHFKGEHLRGMLTAVSAGLDHSMALAFVHSGFYDWCKRWDAIAYWSKGHFDFPILESLFEDNVPWEYGQRRDLKTLCAECDVPKRETTAHTAYQDCEAQIEQLAECRAVLRNRRVE